MASPFDRTDEIDDRDIEILVDALRQCFLAEKARYYINGYQDSLVIEIEGLDDLTDQEIAEVAEPILEELDLEFDEVMLVPLKA